MTFFEDINTTYKDSPNMDAFGRLRTSRAVNVFENKNIHTRNKSLFEEPIIGAIIVHGTVTGGPFQVAEIVTGGTSGTIGTVTAVDGGALTITYIVNHNDFTAGETITGGTSGATATVTTADTGSNIYHNRDEGAVILQVGQLSGDQAIRQTHRYLAYRPGKSQLIKLTGYFGAAVTNVRRRTGLFDDNNGIYIEQNSTGVRFVLRSSTSGSPVNTEVEQADWNKDKLDGTGPSKINYNFAQKIFFFTDFTWQGDGRVRVGVFYDGQYTIAHEFNVSNVGAVPFMSTPTLPVRFEIVNTGATASTNIMKEVCIAVESEGGETLLGFGFSQGTHETSRSVGATTIPLFAVRLKDTLGGGDNRRTVQFLNAGIFAEGNNAHFEIRHIHDPSAITATWTSAGDSSAAEYSSDITAVTGNPAHILEEGYVASGQAGKGGNENVVAGDKLDQHRFITQNFDSTNSEMFVVYATSLTGNADIYSHISWIEFD